MYSYMLTERKYSNILMGIYLGLRAYIWMITCSPTTLKINLLLSVIRYYYFMVTTEFASQGSVFVRGDIS